LDRLSPESVARVLWFLMGWAVRNPEKVSPEEWAELGKINANKPR
jgi:predicted type IV restriction endonuclease